MKNIELQQIRVFINETSGFVHVGIYNMFDKEGNPNYSANLDSLYGKAKRSSQIDETISSMGAELAFGGSFNIRLMNTPREDWITAKQIINLTVFDAQDLAEEFRVFYENDGYDVTGLKGTKPIRRDGSLGKSINNIKIKNATIKRIYQIVDRLTEGMTGINVAQARRDIYNKYVSKYETDFDTRRKFWHYIIRNWDRYSM